MSPRWITGQGSEEDKMDNTKDMQEVSQYIQGVRGEREVKTKSGSVQEYWSKTSTKQEVGGTKWIQEKEDKRRREEEKVAMLEDWQPRFCALSSSNKNGADIPILLGKSEGMLPLKKSSKNLSILGAFSTIFIQYKCKCTGST